MEKNELTSTRLSPSEAGEIEQLVKKGFFLNKADFVRSAVRKKFSRIEIHMVRETSVKQSEKEVL